MTNALEPRNNNQIVPQGASRGMEGANMEGMSFPRVLIMQPTSPQLSEYDHLKMGDLINNLTFDKVPQKFIPIKVWDSNILFSPREDKPEVKAALETLGLTADDFQASNVLCSAKDGKMGDRFGNCHACGLCKFNNSLGEKPVCNETVNVLGLFEDIPLPILIQFSVTSYKHGKNFKQICMFTGGDIFRSKYTLTSMKKQEKGKTWFEMKAIPAGKCSPEEYQEAEAMWMLTQQDNSYMDAAAQPAEHFEPAPTNDDEIPF